MTPPPPSPSRKTVRLPTKSSHAHYYTVVQHSPHPPTTVVSVFRACALKRERKYISHSSNSVLIQTSEVCQLPQGEERVVLPLLGLRDFITHIIFHITWLMNVQVQYSRALSRQMCTAHIGESPPFSFCSPLSMPGPNSRETFYYTHACLCFAS